MEGVENPFVFSFEDAVVDFARTRSNITMDEVERLALELRIVNIVESLHCLESVHLCFAFKILFPRRCFAFRDGRIVRNPNFEVVFSINFPCLKPLVIQNVGDVPVFTLFK